MAEIAIIGRVPGYNTNTDLGGDFEKELKKGITYIDMFPTAYTDTLELLGAAGAPAEAPPGVSDTLKLFGSALNRLFKSPGLVKTVPPGKSTSSVIGTTGADPSYAMFKGVLTRMQEAFDIEPGFAAAKSLRIVAANDSTFTETFTNAFDAENSIVTGFNGLKNTINSVPVLPQIFKGAKSFDSMSAMNLVGGMYNSINNSTGLKSLAELASGAAVGMNIAAPQMWSASQYNSTLTLFVKLVSPTGSPHCIRKNILEPLLYLIAASSPVTGYGMVYGYPLMWQVHAHGITNFRIGSIAALSIIRGSFETTFTKSLQPTVVDVRLTIIPLLADFAVQTNADNTPSIYTDENSVFLGVQNPADIVRGTMNKQPMAGRTFTPEEIVSVKI